MAENLLPVTVAGLEEEFSRVEVRRSPRRKKTISAEVVGDVLVVSVPQRMSLAEEQQWVDRMALRMGERRRRDRLNQHGELTARATALAAEYLDGVSFSDITWIETQRSRWGYCIPSQRSIRISLVVSQFPTWVRDYVIVHELAHLVIADHSDAFWRLVQRYPLTERARGFLIAKGMEEGA